MRAFREKIAGSTGSISGIASVLGSWQVCHNICMIIIATLAVVGITVIGMPLGFLIKWALPLWSIAFALFLVILSLYIKKKCISKKLLFFNAGLIIAGIPFKQLQSFSLLFWIIGGILVATSVILFIKERRNRRCDHET